MLNQMSLRFRSVSPVKVLTFMWMGLLSLGILSNPYFSYPGRDGGIFLYVGSLILKGKIPYLDVWENKGPLVFYINALGLALSGGSRWGVWFLEFLFFFGAGVLGYGVIKRLMGAIPALVGTFVWIITAGNVLQGGNFSEEYSLLFSFIAIFAFWKSLEQPHKNFYSLLAGISLGLNILLRPNNISMQIAAAGAYFVMAVFSKEWRIFFTRALWYAIGLLLVMIPVILYFASQGALTEMINVVLVFNIQYSDGFNLVTVLDGLRSASLSIGIEYVAIAILGYVLSLWLFFKNGINTLLGKFLLILLIGWPIEAVLSALSGRNYLHYFIGWAPYAGLLCSYAAYLLLRQFAPNSEKYSVYILLVFIVITLFGNIKVWKDYGAVLAQKFSAPNAGMDYRDPVASYIMENTSPGEKVFVWGFRPIINFMSGRESPASFLPYPLIHVDTPLGDHWAEQFYSQLTTDPPALIVNMIEPADRERIPDLDPLVRKQYKIKYKEVVLAPNLQDTLDFITKNYVRIGEVDGYDIYRLQTSTP
jgi:hypothetical protein